MRPVQIFILQNFKKWVLFKFVVVCYSSHRKHTCRKPERWPRKGVDLLQALSLSHCRLEHSVPDRAAPCPEKLRAKAVAASAEKRNSPLHRVQVQCLAPRRRRHSIYISQLECHLVFWTRNAFHSKKPKISSCLFLDATFPTFHSIKVLRIL